MFIFNFIFIFWYTLKGFNSLWYQLKKWNKHLEKYVFFLDSHVILDNPKLKECGQIYTQTIVLHIPTKAFFHWLVKLPKPLESKYSKSHHSLYIKSSGQLQPGKTSLARQERHQEFCPFPIWQMAENRPLLKYVPFSFVCKATRSEGRGWMRVEAQADGTRKVWAILASGGKSDRETTFRLFLWGLRHFFSNRRRETGTQQRTEGDWEGRLATWHPQRPSVALIVR